MISDSRTRRMTSIALLALLATPAYSQVLNEDYKLVASDRDRDHYFGSPIAISDTQALIAGGDEDHNRFVSLFNMQTGEEIFRLIPKDSTPTQLYGLSIGIYGDKAIIGDPTDSERATKSGAAYIFDLHSGTQLAKLYPNESVQHSYFGQSVSLYESTAIIGAPGDYIGNEPVYLFDINTGQQTATLFPSDGLPSTSFGSRVAINDSVAVVAAPSVNRVYAFDTSTGQQLFRLVPQDPFHDSEYGSSLAVSGPTAIIGSPGNHDNGFYTGAAYVFDLSTGRQLHKLQPHDSTSGEYFGYSVAISGTSAIVGKYGFDGNGLDSGAAYLFDTTTGQQTAQLLPSDGEEADRFGFAVALNNTTALVGAPDDDDMGSVYVIQLASCSADLTNDGSLDFFDVSAFLTAYAENDPTADFNADGSFNFFDVSAFLVAYLAGCP